MSEERFARLKAILVGALERPAAERSAWLRAECAGDEELRAEAEAKLARLDEDASVLLTGGLEAIVRTGAAPAGAGPDDVRPSAARFRILERIGEGGFGEVHLAEQLAPVRRRVAVKILKAGLDTRAVLARFEAERQALAVMDHPCIAKVFDAGRTEQGRPYFAMEYVDGLPITHHCDRHRLDTRARLRLFLRACEGVQHAHQRAVIHRDLKPSNVLVGAANGTADVKVIDFGVAKALEQPLTDRTLHTEIGQLIGTPEYMSPEQAEMSGDIDTRTDVYSLGAMLYELLTGQRPHEGARLREGGAEGLRRVIRDTDPPRPSTRVSTASPDEVARVASDRRTTRQGLAGILRGDLDWITMKALERDRSRRYGSPAELAADIERHLRREPVLARPPSALYLAGRLASRHRAPFAVAGGVVLLIAGFGVWMSILYARADRAQAQAVARAEELELVTEFQASMLGQVDPARMGRALHADLRARARAALEESGASPVRAESELAALDDLVLLANPTDVAIGLLDAEVLRRAVQALDQQFLGQPLVRAALQQTVAAVYREYGLLEEAMPLQAAALATRRELLGDEHRDTLGSIDAQGLLLLEMGRLAEGLAFAEEAVAGCRRTLGDGHAATATATLNVAALLWELGRYEEALVRYEEALERARAAHGSDHEDVFIALDGIGKTHWALGDFEEALAASRQALDGQRRLLGDDHRSTLITLGNIGQILASAGRLEEALAYDREALEGYRRTLGREHPFALTALNNVGSRVALLGRLEEAEACFRETVAGRRRVLGDRHAETIGAVNNLGFVLRRAGRPDEALPLYREALEGFRSTLGDDHPSTLSALKNMAKVLADLGRWEEVVALLVPAESAHRRAFTGDNLRAAGDYFLTRGRARIRTGEVEAAREDLEAAQAIFAEAPGVTAGDGEGLAAAFAELQQARRSAGTE